MNINKAIIVGRITSVIELKTLPSGTSVANFSVATNHTYKDQQGQKVDNTTFHNVVSFGKTAETIAQYFVKGQEIFVEGRLDTKSWDDKETGKKMYRTEIILEKFDFGQKPKNAQQDQESPLEEPQEVVEELTDSDIPF